MSGPKCRAIIMALLYLIAEHTDISFKSKVLKVLDLTGPLILYFSLR